MMRFVTQIIFIGAALSAAAETPADRRVIALEDDFRFDSSIKDPVVGFVASSDDVVLMDAVTVTESMLRRHLVTSIAQNEKRLKDREFSWKKGGRIRSFEKGPAQFDLGIWPELEHESAGNQLTPILRAKLLQIRW